MIRSRFQYSIVTQSVLHSYLVGFVLLYYVQHCNCSHLPPLLQQCLCTESEVCTRTGYELYELLLIVSQVSTVSSWMGNGQLALIRSREVASPQGLLNKVSLVDFNPDLSVRPL